MKFSVYLQTEINARKITPPQNKKDERVIDIRRKKKKNPNKNKGRKHHLLKMMMI